MPPTSLHKKPARSHPRNRRLEPPPSASSSEKSRVRAKPCCNEPRWRWPPRPSAEAKRGAFFPGACIIEKPPRPSPRKSHNRAQRFAPCHTFPMSRPQPGLTRDLAELILGYGLIVAILWTPEPLQRILSPIALVAIFMVVVLRRSSRKNEIPGDERRHDDPQNH